MCAALGLDIGTTNLKVVLVSGDGAVTATAQRGIQTSRNGPVAEQDADQLWHHLRDAVAEVAGAQPDVSAEVKAIGVCSQYSSIVPVNAAAQPVGPMILWSDQRGSDHSWNIIAQHDEAFLTWIDRHGIPTVGGGLALAHILYLQHEQPEIHAKTAAYLEPMDYVTARLTGNISATQHSMFMSQLCDNRTLGVTDYDDELVRMAGVDPNKLPGLVAVDSPIGTLVPDVAAQLGLPASVVVYPGFNDTATLGLAAGVHRLGHAGLAIGTTSVLVDTVGDKNTDLDHEVLSMPALSRQDYLVFAENGNGGRVVEYVMEQLVHGNDALADHQTEQPFARFDDALAQSEPGAGGILFLPWMAGSLAPNANANMRGGFINMSLEASRTDLVRAAAEGVAHNLAWLLPYVESFTGNVIHDLVFVGGAARSTSWCQILADILNRPIHRAIEPEMAIARTAATHALVRVGLLDPDQIMVETAQVNEPQLANRAMYELHQEQFEATFAALRPISETLTTFHAAQPDQDQM